MKKIYFLLVFLFFFQKAYCQKVANYSFGRYGTSKYEHFSFWEKGSPEGITYSFGKNEKEVKLKYLGKAYYEGKRCFKIQFPNNYVLYIIPDKLDLKIQDSTKTYFKTFSWEYEGPVNGIGTFCDVCAEDEKEALNIVNNTYLN
jgi:hypothetical protein